MKLSKLTVALVVVLAIICLSTSVSAFSNQELINYLTGSHKVLNSDYQLDEQQKKDIRSYLKDNPVSDDEAAKIKAEVEAAKKEIDKSGAKNLDSVPADIQSKAAAKLKAAGNIAGVNIDFNSKDKTAVITDKATGKLVSSFNGKKAVQKVTPSGGSAAAPAPAGNAGNAGASTVQTFAKTGFELPVFIVVALVAVVAVSTIFVKKYNEK